MTPLKARWRFRSHACAVLFGQRSEMVWNSRLHTYGNLVLLDGWYTLAQSTSLPSLTLSLYRVVFFISLCTSLILNSYFKVIKDIITYVFKNMLIICYHYFIFSFVLLKLLPYLIFNLLKIPIKIIIYFSRLNYAISH
jgi:hypothetical protein